MATITDFEVRGADGAPVSLGRWQGQVLLIVNTASKCGFTPQYRGLEALHRKYADRGFEVLGFPANNFGAQEPGTDAEIAEFCSLNYSVDFPMFSKISVLGDDRHPLYTELTAQYPSADTDKTPFRERLSGFGMTPSDWRRRAERQSEG